MSNGESSPGHIPLSGDEVLELPEFDDPPPAPMPLAQRWLADAQQRGVREPLSMTLATASVDGAVSARTVDVKQLDDQGLVFGSSTVSRKGAQIRENPRAALQVYWRESMQQLRFEGHIVTMSDAESDALFAARSPASRAATAAAHQSAPFTDGSTLAGLVGAADDLLERFGDEIPRPATWVGLRLSPRVVEFWQGSRDRMHRRLQYAADDGGWRIDLLQP